MDIKEFELQLNQWGREQAPFFFLIDFEMEKPEAWKLKEVPAEILFSIGLFTNTSSGNKGDSKIVLQKHPLSLEDYKLKFDYVKERISFGDSYLTNLTIKTEIELNQSFDQIYRQTQAKYKVCWKGKFLCFSPETFVRIQNSQIFSLPMKGTIDAALPNAEEIILQDQKELAEHVTIVDLIRNDLSLVATDVNVQRFRYTDKIETNQKNLLQVSSEICGQLPDDYYSRLGSILLSLLPAGSVSGAPKTKTLQIIREAEKEKRGFYTGIMGYFDGRNLDSGVMIRFIEQNQNRFFYRSGGGITSQSNAESEYQEMIDKIYVPIH